MMVQKRDFGGAVTLMKRLDRLDVKDRSPKDALCNLYIREAITTEGLSPRQALDPCTGV